MLAVAADDAHRALALGAAQAQAGAGGAAQRGADHDAAVVAGPQPRRRRRVQHRLGGAADHQDAVAGVAVGDRPRVVGVEQPGAVVGAQLVRVDPGAEPERGLEAAAAGRAQRQRLLPVRQLAAQLDRGERARRPAPQRHRGGARRIDDAVDVHHAPSP
ncbi:MAG: hypothetical protein H6708_18190 [Kofleriaceae bacterium]|nr:hypothetical protein [Kofleriaceae bacterium]